MSDERTAANIDAQLSGFGIAYRWRANADGSTIIYTCYSFVPESEYVDCLLRLRAVIGAIDDSGGENGVSVGSLELFSLVNEHKTLTQKIGALDQKQKDHDSRSRGGGAGKGKARNARSYAIRSALQNLGDDVSIQDVINWLENNPAFLKIQDGLDVFYAKRFEPYKSERKKTRSAISKLLSTKKSEK